MSNESTPLVASSEEGPPKSVWMDRLVTATITALAVMGIVFASNKSSTPHGAVSEMYIPTYRPICKVPSHMRQVRVLQTSADEPTEKWARQECLVETSKIYGDDIDAYGSPDAVIQVNLDKHAHPNRPPILGFGGAFTEASALNFQSLSEDGQEAVLELLFGELGYSLGRVHINSCDFSVESYAYDEVDGDFDLDHFSIQHDIDSGMVDFMQRAQDVYDRTWKDGSHLKLYASPWSPPAWMKAPTPFDDEDAEHAVNMTHSAQPTCLREGVGPESPYAHAWGLYFTKFLESYKKHGLKFYAVTIQNEPEFPAPWEACSYTPETQADFLANHLGPQLRESFPDTAIFIFDHNKDHAPVWIDEILNNPEAAKYVNGTAYHWYAGGMDRLLDGAQGTPNMHRVMAKLENILDDDKSRTPTGPSNQHTILGSEACHCPTTGYAGGDMSVSWYRAERYAHTILADLATGSQGWVEWNLILDSIGGPNHLGNLCDATLLAVPHRASSDVPPTLDFEHAGHPFGRVVGDDRTREELHALGIPADLLDKGVVAQPLFYYMGHISKYVRPGSRPVPALVEASSQGQIFRKDRDAVMGGGKNDLARVGMEVTLWPCEGSTRQQFMFDEASQQLQLMGHDWLGNPTVACVGHTNDKDFLGITTGSCNTTATDFSGTFELVRSDENNPSIVQFVVMNAMEAQSCLVVQELHNEGGAYGPRGGAQVAVGPCSSKSADWTYKEETKEIVSSHFKEGDVCMTTGWPFLQVGAFDTPTAPDAEKTIVILNEAGQSANYVLKDGDKVIMTGSIPAHSIQTVLID